MDQFSVVAKGLKSSSVKAAEISKAPKSEGREANSRSSAKPHLSASSNSRISGFYKMDVENRRNLILHQNELSRASKDFLIQGGGLSISSADRMSENVIATHGLPLSLGLNFQVNGKDVLVPMAVEEPSVVAAASNAAKLVCETGGFFGEAGPSIMITQVQFDEVPDAANVHEKIAGIKDQVIKMADVSIPNMVRRGGGCRDIEVRVLDEAEGIVVVHLHVDVGNAMGANLVDTVAESVAPFIQSHIGGEIGLRILSNLASQRTVKVWGEVLTESLGGEQFVDRMVKASRFAELDIYRAVTHNKGIMNGIDAVALPLGQDWRSIEAGAHGFAAKDGHYKPLAVWRRTDRGVMGTIELPMAVGTVGGSTKAHEGIQAAFELMKVTTAQELSVVMAAAGLASNLAALKALTGEGIQKGHMRLHHRKTQIKKSHSIKPS